MKLNNINSTDDRFVTSLRILLSGTQSSLLSEQLIRARQKPITKSIQQIFVESVIGSGLLSEEDMTGMQALLKAGIAKLRSAITPSSSEDLDVLMSFMAPGTGGSPAVQELIAAAKSITGPLSQDNDWWTNFFSTMNINDRTVQKNIQYQVADELGQEMIRDPGLPSPHQSPESSEVSPEPSVAPEEQGRARRTSSDKMLGRELEDAKAWSSQLQNLITQRRADQAHASKRVNDLNARLNTLMSKVPRESFDFIGRALLEYDSVKGNIGRITNLTIKNINRHCGTTIGTITEAGLLDKLRMMMANPKYAKRTLGQEADSDTNIRGAKMAVQLAIQNMRRTFETKLKSAGLSPEDIVKTYSAWSKMKASGSRDVNQLRVLEKKLINAFQLFDLKPNGETGEIGSVGDGDGTDPLNADKNMVPQQRLNLPAPNNQLNNQPEDDDIEDAEFSVVEDDEDELKLKNFKSSLAKEIKNAIESTKYTPDNRPNIYHGMIKAKEIVNAKYKQYPALVDAIREVWYLYVEKFRNNELLDFLKKVNL